MPDPDPPPEPPREPAGPAPDIPDVPEGTPAFGEKLADVDEGAPVGPTPPFDFWKAIYGRRSIRKFRPDPVPRELVEQVMHAGIWAPSSCNYQMWDFVAVDDPKVNRKLAALSLQMGNAPVNVVVAYGREFSEEGFANVQSASAAIEATARRCGRRSGFRRTVSSSRCSRSATRSRCRRRDRSAGRWRT
jgi:hypothetical protein